MYKKICCTNTNKDRKNKNIPIFCGDQSLSNSFTHHRWSQHSYPCKKFIQYFSKYFYLSFFSLTELKEMKIPFPTAPISLKDLSHALMTRAYNTDIDGYFQELLCHIMESAFLIIRIYKFNSKEKS